MPKLYFIGTCHNDTKGIARLRKFLNEIKPDCAGIECSWESFAEAILRRKIIEEDYNMQMLTEFELLTPLDYKTEEKSEMVIIPLYQNNTQKVELYDQFDALVNCKKEFHFSADNREQLEKIVEKSYNSEESYRIILSYPEIINVLNKMDDEMEKTIREKIIPNFERIVIITGAYHSFGIYGNNLYERLKEFRPIRMKLCWADDLREKNE